MSAEESSSSKSETQQAGVNQALAGEVSQKEASGAACAADNEGALETAAAPHEAGVQAPSDGPQMQARQTPPASTEEGAGNGGGVAGDGAQAEAESAAQAPAVSSGTGVAKSSGRDGNDGKDKPEDEASMSFTEHLGELRMRIVRMLIGATVGFLLCYGVAEELFYYLSLPLVEVMPPDTRLIYTSVPEGFFVYLKVAFVAGVFVASPYIFYQLWAFIAPGLYQEERRHIVPLAFCSAIFFLLGASFCYWGVFPFAFTFFMSYSTGMIVAMPSLNEYLGFALKMLLAFGLIFEMPLFAFFLSRLRIITPAWMRKVRRYAVLAIFIVAAILTPPDVFSQLLMAGPMLILYEVSIYVAAMARPRSGNTEVGSDKAGSSNA